MDTRTGQVYSQEQYDELEEYDKRYVQEIPSNLTKKAYEVLDDETNHYNTVRGTGELNDWRIKNLKPLGHKRKKKIKNKVSKKSRKVNR